MPLLLFFYVVNMSFDAIRENKILLKISKITVSGKWNNSHATLHLQK